MPPQDRPTFAEWLRRVVDALGYLNRDFTGLEDQPWETWYKWRLRPTKAANRAIRRARKNNRT